ncbi:hypothetical protein O2U01_00630 [Ligilactobacillus salivarius]|uniref:Uncharacterized protein n=1 Tax=Ligilactobacillus salivarius TaxID=1624 RepID=A0ABD7YT22_9LACO|nr:hypothetical protein [Ligilactobacillus salivarius]WHS06294.1 hypothetical protein O2U07_03095 [Ligilactobacillus salivarius]WHS07623.1 hypothetical protein O2U05_07655 [Ligilactobacillus salivarius]WHS10213.1 hypothetical protein O2U04_01170 [Ligilactobacillus salivarius]WHS14150.1 hypothetical protein O2U03_00385 [Ligilactobacillus salivarius]WHS17234.1 hypothetical protein O2U02_07050 [Ligilactobacillus salivarius]
MNLENGDNIEKWFDELVKPQSEVKKGSKETKVFLANGKMIRFDNVSSTKEFRESGNKAVLLIKHFDEQTGKKRISCFDLSKENIIGYSVENEL